MTTVPHVTSGLGPRKFQADGFLLTRVFLAIEGGNFFRNIDVYRNNCAASRYVSLNCSLNIEIVFNIWIILSEWSRFFKFSDVNFGSVSPYSLSPRGWGGADTETQDVKFCVNFVHSDDSSVTVVTKATGLDSCRIEVRFPERITFPFSLAFPGGKAGRRVALTTHPYLAPRIK